MSEQQIINTIKEDLENIVLYLMKKYPFYGILLKSLNIYYDPVTTETPAYVIKFDLYITKNFIHYSNKEKTYIIFHELNHLLLKHTIRIPEYISKQNIHGDIEQLRKLANIACDAKANQYNEINIDTYHIRPIYPSDISRLLGYKINVQEIERMSAEEILELLLKQQQQQNSGMEYMLNNSDKFRNVDNDILQDNKGEQNKQLIQEGSEEGNSKEKDELTSQELEEEFNKKVMKAYSVAKSIGTTTGKLEEIIEQLLKPQVNWKVLLRNAIVKGLGRNVKRTWVRPSRKCDLFPGKELLKINKVVVLVDVSGSISGQELQQFLTEVYSIVKETSDVIVILWDTEVKNEFILRRQNDVNKIKITGRGGTELLPALEYAVKKYSGSMFIILSDWEIYDVKVTRSNKLIELLQKVKPICVTTYTIPKIEGLEKNFIKLKI
jgi:predicted metal-dependent peptidase